MDEASKPTKPILIYDGDCTFCVYWASYWQKLTGNKVDYRPYQEVASQYPSISIKSFQRAVQYVSPDGKIASAAKASFLTLSHSPQNRIWLWLYRWLPGFALISEWIYALIASHRGFFYRITLLLWGKHYEPPRYELTSWLFLRSLGIIFFIVFFSFGSQALGLIGSKGIIPVADLVQIANQKLGAERYWYIPMVFWLNSSDIFIVATCWIGMIFSIFLTFNFLTRVSLIFLYVLYLSLIYAGQMFMSFQWDLLVIEMSGLAFILTGAVTLGIWLLRFLMFRFIFAGGMVKIMSGDPTWRDLTSLHYHFYTQPLPTPIAWYANQLPHFLLKFGTFATLAIELFTPFLIFLPRRLRYVAAFFILLLQTTIFLTGNYNFFNISVFVIALALFDDAAYQTIIPHRLFVFLKNRIPKFKTSRIFLLFASVFAFATICSSIVQFQARFFTPMPESVDWVYRYQSPLRLVNTYGPFAVMTTKRMEIIIEGSNDGVNWEEYVFKYKPGDIYRRPLWNIPFQPRLDWQMWFAALGTYVQNPWFVQLMQRILENSPHVLALLEKNPFPEKPPYYVRALFYEYHFTGFEEKKKTGAWWSRELTGLYLPQVNLKT